MNRTISLNKFISHFCQDIRAEKRFCFILGAGASKTSGIDTGGMMARQWIQELEKSDKEDLDAWLTEKKIQRDDYATHYSDIFDKRFELSRKDGFAFLENAMKGAEPSCGYSVLAQILADNKHNIVITTNFDSLTEDALFIYTEKKPLVIGHAALANYIATNLTRPLVVKIHHDLFLSPKNGTEEINKLDENFTKNLKDIFKFYTPLVIGYGGNDGSLMNFLQGLEHIEEGLFWFYLDEKELKPNIKELVNKVDGHFVQIKGFDDLMIRLGDKLGHKSLDVTIENVAKRRADSYRKQIEKLSQNESTDKDTKKAVNEITLRGDISWWSYDLLAREEKDIEKAEEIYEKGIKEFPKSLELVENYAIFLHETKKDYVGAEKYYQKALELDATEAKVNGNYAIFLCDIKEDYVSAEKYYQKALELNASDARVNGNYANFLSDIRKDYISAEKYYRKALKLDVNDANTNGNYAKYLLLCDKKEKALTYINRAFELNKKEERAITLELWFYCYAVFPKEFPKSKEKIKELLEKGVRSIGWDLSGILEIAEQEKHPDMSDLRKFAKQISGEK